MAKTRYRVTSNGYSKRLEYKGLLFWRAVPEPYSHIYYGRDFVRYRQGVITSRFDEFVDKYTDVRDYIKFVYRPEQKSIEKKNKSYRDDIEKRKREIEYK